MRGLPQKRAYETVLRDAMVADSLDPVGIYFGTRSGQLFASRDEGKTWEKILGGLPAVMCVRSAVIGEDGLQNAASKPPTPSTRESSATSTRTSRRTSSRVSRR